jgi:LysM repeat protein
MTTAAEALVADARGHLGELQSNENQCAYFVSRVFAETGHGDAFPATGWVPTLVARMADRQDPNLLSARLGDLAIFGSSEHVAIFSEAGKCIGTLTGADGKTRVYEVSVSSIRTGSGRGFSSVLHTELSQVDSQAPSPTPTPAPPAPPPAPVPAPPVAPTGTFYTVKRDDTLSAIARAYGTTWPVIYNANRTKIGPNPGLIRVGLVLTIPH